MKKLLLIDANSLIHRCFHALPPLSSPEGSPSQSLYGMSSILLRLFRENPPEYAAALFDRPEPTFRKEKYAEYKAHRPKAPDELIAQIISAHDLFPVFGVKTFEEPGWEADDLIATLALKFGKEEDLQVVILTGDLDTLQLVEGDKIVVRTFRKGISDTFTYNDAAVKERYGLAPSQISDYKAFVGDQSDNLKGIAGIGPKTAVDLLVKYGSVENILKNIESDPKIKAKLGGRGQELSLSKELVTLKEFLGMPINSIEELAVKFDEDRIKNYFEKMGFTSLKERLLRPINQDAKAEKKPKASSPSPLQGSMF